VLVPPAVVTDTSTVPAPAGETAVIDVAELTVKLVAPVPPNVTADAPVKFVPLTVTVVPPAAGPSLGLTPLTLGGGTKLKWSDVVVALVPPAVVTVTSTTPVPAGETAVIELAELTAKLAALVAPNLTALAPVKPLPLTVTVVPPASGPAFGPTPPTVGGGRYVNRSAEVGALVPPAVVTVTSTVPVPAGDTALIELSELMVKLAALAEPNLTAVAPLR
jgi:hypothetical protein